MLMLMILAIVQILSPHWWLVMAIPFCFGLLNTEKSVFRLFWQYILAVALLWGGMAVYLQMTYAELVVGRIEGLAGVSHWILVVAAALTGGIAAGFAGATGTSIRKIFSATEKPVSVS